MNSPADRKSPESGCSQFAESINAIAVEAGELILTHFRQHLRPIADKGDHGADTSPVTVADLESNRCITQRLQARYPEIPLISEESAASGYETRKGWRRFWLVDPLDGTKEFLAGSDEFTVNIALVEDGEPTFGTIYVPAKDVLYHAEKGCGSWKRAAGEADVRIFSTSPDLSEGITVVESKSHPSPELENYLKDLPVKKRVTAGSSLKFCLVAEGLADIYPRLNPTMEWDVAAGDCIYRNSARHGQRHSSLTYNKPTLKNDSFVIGFK